MVLFFIVFYTGYNVWVVRLCVKCKYSNVLCLYIYSTLMAYIIYHSATDVVILFVPIDILTSDLHAVIDLRA